MVCLEYFNLQRTFRHLFTKYGLGVERAVIAADTGVVPADNQVAAPGILPEHGMQHRLTRAGIEHVETVTGYHYGILRKIQFHHLANGRIAHVGGYVPRLQLSQQHVDQYAVGTDRLFGHLAQFLMCPVHGITGLEGNDFFPAVGGDPGADLHGCPEGVREILLEVTVVQYLQRACHEVVSRRHERGHAGMVRVQSAEDFFRDPGQLLIRKRIYRGHVLYGKHRRTGNVGVAQCYTPGGADPRGVGTHVQARHRPEQAVNGMHFLCDTDGVGSVHITGQR